MKYFKIIRLFRLFYGDSSGMYKFPSATCMVFIQWWCERGDKSHVSKEISGRGRRRSRGEKGNQGVGDFRFINILQFFLFIIIIISSLFSILFFTHDIYPHPHPRPTPTTHDLYPLPTTFSYTQQGLVTSDEKHLEYGILRNQAFEWERGRQ